MTVRKILQKAVDNGMRIVVAYGYEIDYKGTNVALAMEAITACDEMDVAVQSKDENGKWKNDGWALIVNDPDPEIADCSGWIDREC